MGRLASHGNGEDVEMRARVLRWFRRVLLNQLKWHYKHLLGEHEMNLNAQEKWAAILGSLDEKSPHAKQTFYECMKWYQFGLYYLRGYVYAVTGEYHG